MFAAVFIPDFALQAVLRQEPELRGKAVALIDPALSKPIIVELTAAARAKGVVEGLSASQAMARCAELIIKTRSIALERTATEVLLQTAYCFSPNIEDTAPGVCSMELKGLGLDDDQAVHAWSEQMLTALASVGLAAKCGVAPTPNLALLTAHATNAVRIVRDSNEFVSLLPVAALELPVEIAGILERWGIHTVGALLKLGRSELAERLGPEILPLLNCVSTESIRPLKLVVPKQEFREQIEFENEIETAEPLLFVMHRFVEQLSKRLDALHLVVSQLDLTLRLSSGAIYERQFRIPSPTGEIKTLFRALQTHLETVRTDAPIVGLRLEAKPSLPQTHQFGLFETTLKDPNQFAETLARLTALCGSDRVGTPVPEATHRPDAFQMRAPEFDGKERETRSSFSNSTQTSLPLRRFRPAIPARVELRGQRPALIRSEVFNGAIVDVRGPFRTSGDWWDRHNWAREEWDVQAADGAFYRIYFADGRFFVEGAYD